VVSCGGAWLFSRSFPSSSLFYLFFSLRARTERRDIDGFSLPPFSPLALSFDALVSERNRRAGAIQGCFRAAVFLLPPSCPPGRWRNRPSPPFSPFFFWATVLGDLELGPGTRCFLLFFFSSRVHCGGDGVRRRTFFFFFLSRDRRLMMTTAAVSVFLLS